MARAVLEGVAFSLKDCFGLMENANLPDQLQVRIAGGGAKSAVWRQIIADVIAQPLVTTNSTEGAAFGAALLAAVGAGSSRTWRLPAKRRSAPAARPSRSDPAAYDHAYGNYRALYPALKDIFAKM